jgi:hypothetical protein
MFGFICCGLGLSNKTNSQEDQAIEKHKSQIGQSCETAITNIYRELRELARRYPAMSGIDSASIIRNGARDSGNIELEYSKSVRSVPYPSELDTNPGPNIVLKMRPTTDKLVVDKGGAKLTILIENSYEPGRRLKMGGEIYPLLFQGQEAKIQLIYDLQLGVPDQALATSVKDIVEKQAGLLGKSLQNIIGSDPVAERAQACALGITNILGGLKAIEQKFPDLSGIGSATIERKGVGYVYSHLRYWTNAHAGPAAQNVLNHALPLVENPIVEKGGIALDVYILSADEPFGYKTNSVYRLYARQGHEKIELIYSLHFNHEDQLNNLAQVKTIIQAIKEVIEKQEQNLRKTMDSIVDF